MIDKNQSIIDYLITCPLVIESPLYFNFINAKNDTKQLITESNVKYLNRTYVDGSVLKQYQCSIIDFRSIVDNAIVKQAGYDNENVEEFLNVQGLIEWIDEQNSVQNYPDFGEDCEVQEIRTTSENPNLDMIDASVTPALAKYSISIEVEYLDKSKVIWNNK